MPGLYFRPPLSFGSDVDAPVRRHVDVDADGCDDCDCDCDDSDSESVWVAQCRAADDDCNDDGCAD